MGSSTSRWITGDRGDDMNTVSTITDALVENGTASAGLVAAAGTLDSLLKVKGQNKITEKEFAFAAASALEKLRRHSMQEIANAAQAAVR